MGVRGGVPKDVETLYDTAKLNAPSAKGELLVLPHFSATLNFPSFVLCRIRSFPDRGTGAPGKRSFRVPPHDNTHHQRKGAGLIVFVCAPAGACRLRTAPAPCCARTHANCLAPTVAWTSPPPFPPPPTAPQPDARMAGTQSPLCVCVCVLGAGAREGAEGPPGSCSAAAPLPHGSCAPLVSTRLAYMTGAVYYAVTLPAARSHPQQPLPYPQALSRPQPQAHAHAQAQPQA